MYYSSMKNVPWSDLNMSWSAIGSLRPLRVIILRYHIWLGLSKPDIRPSERRIRSRISVLIKWLQNNNSEKFPLLLVQQRKHKKHVCNSQGSICFSLCFRHVSCLQESDTVNCQSFSLRYWPETQHWCQPLSSWADRTFAHTQTCITPYLTSHISIWILGLVYLHIWWTCCQPAPWVVCMLPWQSGQFVFVDFHVGKSFWPWRCY